MSTFLLEIITPERIAFSEQVEMITTPTSSGLIGILPHHTNLFTRLTEGELKIVKSQKEYFLAIGGGFMEVTKEKVLILVTEAYHADEINEKEVLAARQRAKDALIAKPEGVDLKEAQAIFRRSEIAIKVLRKKKSHSTSVS